MRPSSIHSLRRSKGKSSETLYQISLSRYLRAFSKARAMQLWRPRLLTKAIGATAFAASLTIGSATSYAQFPAVFELSSLDGTNGFVINGINAGGSISNVSDAGDVNGDGIDDLVIGAPYADRNGDNDGESYVVFGSNNGFPSPFNLSGLNGANGFVIKAARPLDYSGISVSGAGDVNGDGIDDLIIGANGGRPLGNVLTGITNAVNTNGESYVVFGSNGGFSSSINLGELDGTDGFVINGVDVGDSCGFSVSGAGDINGDGIDDLIFGAPYADSNGNFEAGGAYVVFGSSGGFSASLNLSDLDGTNGFVINGIDSCLYTGGSVSDAGDVNGDGIDDLVIGNTNYSGEVGESYVVFGSSGGFSPSLNLSSLDGANGFAIKRIVDFDFSGRSVSGAGDINGDGIVDIVIGAPSGGSSGNGRTGESYVVFGSNGGFSSSLNLSSLNGINGFQINGVDSSDASGVSVSGAGDVNGDGLDDLIIGAPLARHNGVLQAGESYVVFGSSGGFSSQFNLSNLDGTNGFQINGLEIADQSGGSVSGAGDVNGDGIDDFLVGASGADPAGEIYIVFGRAASDTLKGDVDLDGDVDFLDIAPFIAVLASTGFQAEADVDCSEVVDFLDIQPFIELLSGN